jgi:hypothetical protein
VEPLAKTDAGSLAYNRYDLVLKALQ